MSHQHPAASGSSRRLVVLVFLFLFAVVAGMGLGLLWAMHKLRPDEGTQRHLASRIPQLEPTLPADAGRAGFMSNCAACHGTRGQGMPRQGPSIIDSQWLRDADDAALMELLIDGRTAAHPDSVMRLPMPPRAGNPRLTDSELRVIAAYTRQLQQAHLREP